MSQTRIQDYGSPVIASSLKILTNSLVGSGILNGNGFSYGGSDTNGFRLNISPGRCVTNQGVIVIEDEIQTIYIPNTSSGAEYTVYYSHVDADISGGIPATLTLDSGFLNQVDGCILGFIQYTGGNEPLNASHFIQPLPLKLGTTVPTKNSADWIVPIKGQNYLTQIPSGGSVIDITDWWDPNSLDMYVRLRNNRASGIGTVGMVFPFKVYDLPYMLLQITATAEINANLSFTFIDTDKVPFAIGSISGQTNFSLKSFSIPKQSVQKSNTIVYIQVTASILAGREARIQSLGLSQYSQPY